ncbi:hypothetical protein QBC32DRAFT_328775 [Pseudoneurospora amorphoporcata]|uniref:Uncharacterized protein n=1 Tax=Pseudoneurospora amorphoporcata TaxID=241081 RepID=A0AAN6NP09_9PEZI|nr:hypothetical protein QBC32DRAFT_328775 [Pseudoneurospora amorphoporcata]
MSDPTHPLIPSGSLKNVGYGEEELRAVVQWVRRLQEEEGVERVVIVDFGAAKEVTEVLVKGLKSTSKGDVKKELEVLVLAVGNECKVYSGEEIQARMANGQALGKVQFNTSGRQDWVKYDLNVIMVLRGPNANGIEGAWEAFCGQKLAPNAGIVVRLEFEDGDFHFCSLRVVC